MRTNSNFIKIDKTMFSNSNKLPFSHQPDLEREIGRLIISGFDGKAVSSDLKKALHDGLGGVLLFPQNLGTPKEILELCAGLRDAAGEEGLMISIDHEGGRVQRLGEPFTHFPPFAAMGRAGDAGLARAVGQAHGRELAAVGINLNFSPVVDLAEPNNKVVIGDRSLGVDPESVSRLAAAYIEGMQSEGVAACAKHFPGHGAATGDSHTELPETLLSIEEMAPHLEPFKRLAESGVAAIMTAHVKVGGIDPYYPATLSSTALRGILREKMKFNGVIITDDVQMAAVAESVGAVDAAFVALRSGADMALVAHDLNLAVHIRKHTDLAVRHVAILIEDIAESFERVKTLRRCYNDASKPRPPLDIIGCAEHRDLAQRLRGYLSV